MKFILMLLLLFLLIDPVIAKSANDSAECLNMYGRYMEKYGASQLIPGAQMRDFIVRCLPDNSANNTNSPTYIDGTRRQKLFHTSNKNKITSIKM